MGNAHRKGWNECERGVSGATETTAENFILPLYHFDFLRFVVWDRPCVVNVDAIRYVSPYSLYRNCNGTVYFCDGEELKLQFLESFEEVIAKILVASTVKEKENLPPV